MKRILGVIVCVFLLGALSCGSLQNKKPSPGSKVLESPKVSVAEKTKSPEWDLTKYKNGEYVVFEESECTCGEKLWQKFYTSCQKGKPATVKLFWYYAAYEQQATADNMPTMALEELVYDGSKFTITSRGNRDEVQEKEYKFLKKYTGEPTSKDAIFSSYEYYVLVNDNRVTWEDIEHGMFSSQSGDYIDHAMVFQKIFCEDNIVNKTFTYEKSGFYGDFGIRIDDDGTYTYYEGNASSYIGVGKWELHDSTLIMTDDYFDGTIKNIFKVGGDKLVWTENGSSNFKYVKLKDGAVFYRNLDKGKEGSYGE